MNSKMPLRQEYADFVAQDKYFARNGKGELIESSVDEARDRVAVSLASTEQDRKAWSKNFREVLEYASCGGRVMANAGLTDTKKAVSLINCLGGDTPVLTSKGIRSIRSLAASKKPVYVLNGAGNWSKVVFKSYGVQETVGLKFIGLNRRKAETVRSTLNHRWILSSGKVITSEYWLTGDTNSRHTRIPNVCAKSPNFSGDQFNEGLLHGLIYGDGSYTEHNRNNGDLRFTLDLVGEKYHSFGSFVENFTGVSPKYYDYSAGVYRFHNIPMEIHAKKLPEKASGDYIAGFFAGLLGTDGSIGHSEGSTKRKSSTISICGNKELVQYLYKTVPTIGIVPISHGVRSNGEIGSVTNYGVRKSEVWSITFNPSTVSPKLVMHRKQRKDLYVGTDCAKVSKYWTYVGCDSDFKLEEVFCCEEPETNSFVLFNGLLTGNCTVSGSIDDSMDGILTKLKEAGMTLKHGCGIGYEFSTLRPKGSFVGGVGAVTSGPMSFMDVYDRSCFTVRSAGDRRGAQMATFDIGHPDAIDFITAKKENKRLECFNLSNLITDKFMDALKADEIWQPTWNNEPFGKSIRAAELWDIVMRSTYEFAEPGILFVDQINRMNPLWFVEYIRATNPCVTGDTVILTERGYERIDSLVDQEVDVWNGFEWSTVTPTVTGENQEIIDFEFSEGSKLSCTPYHTFILSDGSKVKAKDLHVGTKLAKFSMPVVEGSKSIDERVAYTQGFYSGDGQKDTRRIWLYEGKCDLLPYLAVSAASDQSASSLNERIMATMDRDPMPKDFVPTSKFTVKTRLDWLAGLFDSDGSVSNDGVVQVWSTDRDFLHKVKLMLNTLGANASLLFAAREGTATLPDGKGGTKEYEVQECWRLCISATHISNLVELGLLTQRLDLGYVPQRDASRFTTVTFMRKRKKLAAKVYCFTEPKNHTGIFNGIMTGQCGEQPLPPYGSCLLGSLNLVKFVVNPFTDRAFFDYGKFRWAIRVFSRMLDNVVEINGLPLPQQVEELVTKRRHGAGYMGLGSALTMLKVPYNSPDAIAITGEINRVLAMESMSTGVELALEKGAAPIFDRFFDRTSVSQQAIDNHKRNSTEYTIDVEKVLKAKSKAGTHDKFKELYVASRYFDAWRSDGEGEGILTELRKHGSRFTHATSIAPTGTISIAFGDMVSNGIEPEFSHEPYIRNMIVKGHDSKKEVVINSYAVNAYMHYVDPQVDVKNLPSYFVTADSISPTSHIDIQASAQVWVDSAISKTINCATDIPFEEFRAVYQYAYDKGLKGCSTFRFNPERFSGVLVRQDDLKDTSYTFNFDDGTKQVVRGDQYVEYKGQTHLASNLADAIRNGYFGKFA